MKYLGWMLHNQRRQQGRTCEKVMTSASSSCTLSDGNCEWHVLYHLLGTVTSISTKKVCHTLVAPTWTNISTLIIRSSEPRFFGDAVRLASRTMPVTVDMGTHQVKPKVRKQISSHVFFIHCVKGLKTSKP